jgi:hypothetical protein
MKHLLEQQSDIIDATLARHGIPARVTGGTVAPRHIRYDIGPLGLLEETLAAALGVPAVRVVRSGGKVVAVEVPRTDPQPVCLAPLLRGMHRVPPLTAILGVADDGIPLLLRLASPSAAHLIVTGPARCGKTSLLRAIAISLAYFPYCAPERCGYAPAPAILALGEALADLSGLPGVRWSTRWRDLTGEDVPRPAVWVVDRVEDLPPSLVEAVLRRGIGQGVHLVAASRDHAALAGLCPVRVAAAPEAEGPGDFVAYAEGGATRFWAAWPDEDVSALFPAYGGNKEDVIPLLYSGDGREGGNGRLPHSL